MLLCWTCVSSCVCAPWLGPFRRTPLALHCTEGSSRGASAIPLGGRCLYSPNFRQGIFSETGLPPNDVLGNSRGFRGFREKRPELLDSGLLSYQGCLLVFYLTLLPFRLLLGRRCLAAQQPLTAASFLANPPIGRTDERSLNRPTQGESLSHSGHRRCGRAVLP